MLTVAAVQFRPDLREKTKNLLRLATMCVTAARNGARLIVLPELCTTGYSFMSANDARQVAEEISMESPTMQAFAAIAREHEVHVVWGMVERDRGTGKLYNSQVYVDSTGYYECYRKINLWGNDFLWACPGIGSPPVIRARFSTATGSEERRVGLLVCRDIRNKESADWKDFYDKGDAQIVAFSTNWGDGGFPAVSWVDFAKSKSVYLVVANRYGKETPNDFGEGGSCVITPEGHVHCSGLKWHDDCIVYLDC